MNTLVMSLMVLTSTATELQEMEATIRSMQVELESSTPEPKAPESKAPELGSPTIAATAQRPASAGPALGVYTRLSSVIPGSTELAPVASVGALVRFEFGVSYAMTSPVEGLGIELGLAAGAQTRRLFDEANALLGLTSLQVSAVYRQPVWSYFGAYARGTGSVDWGHFTARESVGGTELDDVAVGFTGAGVLGAEVAFPLGYTQIESGAVADQFMSFYFEMGYAVSTSLTFDELRRDVDEDDPPRIARTELSAGSVDLSGVVWRMGMSFRF